MSFIDPTVRSRIEPLLRRVLIVEPNPHQAQLLGECLTAFGGADFAFQADPDAAVEAAGTFDPTLIVTEAFDDADPFALVRSIRRSSMTCRQAAVVVLTTLATTSGLQAAKNAGVNEFLRKPFNRPDLLRRLNHLSTPRPWVDKLGYAGPDRRTFNSGAAKRRLSDRVELIGQGVPATQLYRTGQPPLASEA